MGYGSGGGDHWDSSRFPVTGRSRGSDEEQKGGYSGVRAVDTGCNHIFIYFNASFLFGRRDSRRYEHGGRKLNRKSISSDRFSF